MTVLAAALLFVNALFNFVVWPQFFKRVAKDSRARDTQGRPTPFFKVHAVLIGIALLIAVASAVSGIMLLV